LDKNCCSELRTFSVPYNISVFSEPKVGVLAVDNKY
jgi:hypothetical protein